jgi:hypothetical protein
MSELHEKRFAKDIYGHGLWQIGLKAVVLLIFA